MEEKIIYHQKGKDSLYKIWHASEEHLFMYIYSGDGSIVSNPKSFPIAEGTLIFLSAGTYHYTMPEHPEDYDRSKLCLAPEKLNRILDILNPDNNFRNFRKKAIVYAYIDKKDRNTIDKIFQDMNACTNLYDSELLQLISGMRLLVYLQKYSQESTPGVSGYMSQALEYINQNIALDISIDQICTTVNVSKYHFCRRFKKYTGLTVMQYILKTRILLAKNELRKTHLSISQISDEYGFSSVSYFCRVFKEEENCTPLQYRKNAAKGLSVNSDF